METESKITLKKDRINNMFFAKNDSIACGGSACVRMISGTNEVLGTCPYMKGGVLSLDGVNEGYVICSNRNK